MTEDTIAGLHHPRPDDAGLHYRTGFAPEGAVMISCDAPSRTTHRTLIDGRIPQVWDLPTLRKFLSDAQRLVNAPDPRDATYFRERVETLAKAIQETEADDR